METTPLGYHLVWVLSLATVDSRGGYDSPVGGVTLFSCRLGTCDTINSGEARSEGASLKGVVVRRFPSRVAGCGGNQLYY